MSRRLRQWILIAAALFVVPAVAAEEKKTFTEGLREQRRALSIADGQLRGEGAAWLLERAGRAQFVLIGEDHGFADVPEFAMALQRGLGERRMTHLVVEVGAHSTARIEEALRASPDGLAKINARYPLSLPFLSLREDGALAAMFVREASKGRALWGVDQEFILATRAQLNWLQARAANDAARRLGARYLAQADAAWRAMIEQHSPDKAVLTQWTSDDFAALRAAFDDDGQARELIDALEISAQIYREQNTTPYHSNALRAQGMKREFMRQYDAAVALGEKAPRVMFKMGAFHAGRGLSGTRQFDIGNLASELAQANGGESFHVLVLAISGKSNRLLAFSADPNDRAVKYDAAEELAIFDAKTLLDAADDKTMSVFDLTALREYGKPRPPAGSALHQVLYNYDAVILIPDARPASNYP